MVICPQAEKELWFNLTEDSFTTSTYHKSNILNKLLKYFIPMCVGHVLSDVNWNKMRKGKTYSTEM